MKLSERLDNLKKEYNETVAEWNILTGYKKAWLGMSLVDMEYEISELSKNLKLYGDKEL